MAVISGFFPGYFRVISGLFPCAEHMLHAFCYVSGGSAGVVLTNAAVGVTVANNYIHNFTFAAVMCGLNVHATGDCLMNSVTNNKVVVESFVKFSDDGAAFYFDTHWTSVGKIRSIGFV